MRMNETKRMTDEEFADAVRFLETGMRPNEKATLRMCEEARRARESEAAALDALEDLLVWAEWHRKRRGAPSMNEPNTGAIDAALAQLTKAGRR